MPGRVQPEVLPSFIPAHPQLSKKRFYQCFSSFFFDVDLVSSKRSKKNSFVVTILFIKNSFLIEIHVGTHSKSIWKKYYFYWRCSFLKLYSIRYYWKKEKEKNRLKFRKIEEYIYIYYRFIVAKMIVFIRTWQLDTDQRCPEIVTKRGNARTHQVRDYVMPRRSFRSRPFRVALSHENCEIGRLEDDSRLSTNRAHRYI